MTPPTLSTAAPTAVMGSTTKYMLPYLHNRRLDDPLPKCWKTNEPGPPAGRMVKVDKNCIHFNDRDSCDIFMGNKSHQRLLTLVEPKRKMSVHTLGNDAPEMAFAVRSK
ncbi:Hypothetical predicted protein [Paramuricea clavata]|uniref:Uncharacterized protein n=1 Tax=Paramuricea clavata TaxID=317549 RepID=A0A6S7I4Z4_PARCT|nr:Hypothetical predicted protein [Paramuricea clavata]